MQKFWNWKNFRHAFGAYTGSDFDIEGQIQFIKDPDYADGQEDRKQSDFEGTGPAIDSNSHRIALSGIDATSEAKPRPKIPSPFDGLSLVYPVGRNIACLSLQTKKMRFIQLPQDAKEVTAIAVNHQKNLIAVATKLWEFVEHDNRHLVIHFYSIERGQFKRQSQYTIRATQGAIHGVPASKHQVTLPKGGKKMQVYERYIKSMAFSKCDKNFVICIKNGLNESIVQTYDMQIKNKKISIGNFK